MQYLDDHTRIPPIWPEILPTMARAAALGGNPSSLHRLGQKARRAMDDCVMSVRALVGACRAEVLVTSGIDEANALGIWGLAQARRSRGAAPIVVCDQGSVAASGPMHAAFLRAGYTVEVVKCDPVTGLLDLDQFQSVMAAHPSIALIALCLIHPSTGIIQPIEAIGSFQMSPHTSPSQSSGTLLYVDADPAAGRMPLLFDTWGIDAMGVSARSFGGPPGVGALVLRPGADPQPLWYGGGQERGFRPGTQPVALAVGMGMAADLALQHGSK